MDDMYLGDVVKGFWRYASAMFLGWDWSGATLAVRLAASVVCVIPAQLLSVISCPELTQQGPPDTSTFPGEGISLRKSGVEWPTSGVWTEPAHKISRRNTLARDYGWGAFPVSLLCQAP
ncbi:Hypothetical protein Deide_1p01731 (plasmid) [Deinococcus deserti VCD115]|uniref:Uncharacterized protein n=1 Tax=Deinococcus deserti (strain DSM 17065 / CIP 109153 / LMG 22923 / VCD115) TaxID=546414 RepID=C1D2I7_DEIDV|nr:Hypothetical protein Deide_1p01731 [Deinococcus deserti VCD115]